VVSDQAIDIVFPGFLGAPINPGVAATHEVVFQGTYTGRARKWTSYRPFIGCIPTAGGSRTPTALRARPLPPAHPTVWRVRTFRLRAGELLRATHGCRTGEHLISASHAVGLRTQGPPTAAQLAAVRVVRAQRGDQILVSATRRALPPLLVVEVQVQAHCTRAVAGP
jgi:hypothetical protein